MTNEDLMQLKQLLDAQKQEIVAEMDRKLGKQKEEIIQQCTANMNVLIESMIRPQINLLAENMELMEQRLNTRMDELEENINERCDTLEMLVITHGKEITRLKKAQ